MTEYSKDVEDRLKRGMGCWSDYIPGWAPMIEDLNEELRAIDPDYVIDQVKQKFGQLRYYVGCVHEAGWDEKTYTAIYATISEYEEKSKHVCEQCGDTGECLAMNRWYNTHCDACRQARELAQ